MVASALALTSSREILKIRLIDPIITTLRPDLFTVLVDPLFPDGTEYLSIDGDLRVLGDSKIADFESNTVRNATASEISTFLPAYDAFENLLDAESAIDLAETNPAFRKLIKALIKVIIANFNATNSRVNTHSQRLEDIRANLSGSGTYGAFRTSTISLPVIPGDLSSNITLQQAAQFLRNQISEND